MKKTIIIFSLFALILSYTSCSVHEDFLEYRLDDVMVIIDDDGGYLFSDDYYIFDNKYRGHDYFRLPYDDDLYGFVLDIDGRVYPPETYFEFIDDYWYFHVRDEYNNFDVAKDEGIYYEYPSNRTFVFTAVWK